MGKLEQKNKQSLRRTKVQKAIITSIGIAGALAIGTVAPNVVGVLGKMKFPSQRKMHVKYSLSRLISAGYIAVENNEGEKLVRLTEKGELLLLSFENGSGQSKQRKWDKKWRIVIYDFHGPATHIRKRVNNMLTRFGFVRIQGSVWVSPYDCEDLITLLKAELKIGKNLLYIIADHIEHDQALRTEFNLPKTE